MIGIGIDVIETKRFKHWKNYKTKQLLKIFHQSEVDYCLSNLSKIEERFASHFAIKEAFYKAICPLIQKQVPFLKVCKNIYLLKYSNTSIPYLKVKWNILNFNQTIKNPKVSISLSHSKTIVCAVLLLY